jgi:voltage-gated potassium channel
MAIVDILAILPFYLPLLIPVDLRFLRILRLLRVVRIFKLARYSTGLATVGRVLKNSAPTLLSAMGANMILMIIASLLEYYAEGGVQPENFDNAFSGLWWVTMTITTVGYGDVYPLNLLGKLLAAIIAVLGVLLVAIPTGILSAGFMTEAAHQRHDVSPQETPDMEDQSDRVTLDRASTAGGNGSPPE